MSRAKLAVDVGNTNVLHPHLHTPDDIIDNILIRLPIEDAVRTSVLSKNWRLQWQKMSKLVFNWVCVPPVGLDWQYKLMRMIYSVLSLHVGLIQKFELSSYVQSFPDVDIWIVILKRNHIKEIILNFSGGEPYSVPSHLFSCDQLTYLNLCQCELKPSLSFSQLPNLKILTLRHIQDPGGRVETLICSCPSLEAMDLHDIDGPNNMKLYAPRLYYLNISNVYFDITTGNALCVNSLAINLKNACDNQHLNQEERIKIAKILGCLLELSKLVLDEYALQWFFSDGHILDRLPATHEHMEELRLSIDFTVKEEFLASLCLLRSFPNLKVLEISVESTGSHNTTITSSSPPIDLDVTFHHLSLVRVANMIGVQEELLLVKRILANTPALHSLEISIDPDNGLEISEIFIELLRYPRASTVAEVIYKRKITLPVFKLVKPNIF